MNLVKIWFKQIRGDFLILPIMLVAIASAAAYSKGFFNLKISIITLIGCVLSHISVNLFNEYSDYKTGIDFKTERTPFSGGSGNLQKKLTKPEQVLFAAVFSLFLAFIIGLYLIMQSGWLIIIFMILGAIACAFYTPVLSRFLMGEFFAGLCLGSFMVMGAYYVFTKSLTFDIIFVSIAPGILTSLLLYLNEFPDAEADKSGGRKHLVIYFGKRIASIIYVVILLSVYVFIVLSVILKYAPIQGLIALVTAPIAFAAARITLKYHSDNKKLLPALAMNVVLILLTDFLIALGFFIS